METTELEQKILDAAEKLFLEKGFNGTSTTDIAREVGCNQALVHYYYRTKDRLFNQIYLNKIDSLLEYIDVYQYDGDVVKGLSTLVNMYFEFLSTHRQTPFLILNELILNPERRALIREKVINDPARQRGYYTFDKIVQDEIRKGTIREIETFDLFINVLSLVVMTFLTLPAYQDLLQKDESDVNKYIAHRREEVIRLLSDGLILKNAY